jgi:hypothetical protein
LNFSEDPGITDNKTSSGNGDIFLTKFNSMGKYLSTKKMGSAQVDEGNSLIIENNNLIVIGYFDHNGADFSTDWGLTDPNVMPRWDQYGILIYINQSLVTSIQNLTPTLNAIDITSTSNAETPSAIFPTTPSRLIRLSKTDSSPIANVTTSLLDDRNWSIVSADSDITTGKSFAHNLSTAPGVISGNFTLYVPKVSNHTQVLVCPNASSLDQVQNNCASGYVRKTGDAGLTVENVSGQDYWVIANVTGSGGLSGGTMPVLAETGQNILPIILTSILVLFLFSRKLIKFR